MLTRHGARARGTKKLLDSAPRVLQKCERSGIMLAATVFGEENGVASSEREGTSDTSVYIKKQTTGVNQGNRANRHQRVLFCLT